MDPPANSASTSDADFSEDDTPTTDDSLSNTTTTSSSTKNSSSSTGNSAANGSSSRKALVRFYVDRRTGMKVKIILNQPPKIEFMAKIMQVNMRGMMTVQFS